jgi:DNA-binding transcriptional ArsR family regulator
MPAPQERDITHFHANDPDTKMNPTNSDGYPPHRYQPNPNGKKLQLLTFSELKMLPKPHRLVGPLFPRPGLTAAFGPPKSGKTFVVMDATLRIVTGMPWHDGSPVEQGDAIWVASEGVWGLADRCDSWIDAHGLDLPDRIRFLPVPVNLFEGEPSELVSEIEELGLNPKMIVFDSLAGCSVGANESSPSDRQQTIDAAIALTRRYRCNVTVIHHTTKDGLSERGTNALRGAADQMFRIDKKEDQITIRSEAERDAAPFDPIHLELVEHEDSLVVRGSDSSRTNRPMRSGISRRIEDFLAAQPLTAWLTTPEVEEELGASRSAVSRQLKSLVDKGIAESTKLEGPGSPKAYRLLPEAREALKQSDQTLRSNLCLTTSPLGGSGETKASGLAWTEGQFQ